MRAPVNLVDPIIVHTLDSLNFFSAYFEMAQKASRAVDQEKVRKDHSRGKINRVLKMIFYFVKRPVLLASLM